MEKILNQKSIARLVALILLVLAVLPALPAAGAEGTEAVLVAYGDSIAIRRCTAETSQKPVHQMP